MFDAFDRTGVPPTGEELRAALVESGMADGLPVTGQLIEEIAQLGDQQTGNSARDEANILMALVRAIVRLERRITDLQSGG